MNVVARPEPGTQPDAQQDAATTLLYLYCVVEAGTAAQRLLAERRVPGMQPEEPLFAVQAGTLVAAVSRVPADVFAEEPLNNLLTDLPRLAPLVVQHEETIRRLMPAAPALIPMSFGAVYHGPDRVAALLRERGPELHRLLARLRDREEWGLKVFADPAWLAEVAEAASPELRELEEQTKRAGPGRAYLLGKRRERLVSAESERWLRQALQDVLAALGSLSAAVHCDEPVPVQADVAPLVLKAAFLVDAAGVERFRSIAAEVAQTYRESGLTLDVSGPWAPYSFVADSDNDA